MQVGRSLALALIISLLAPLAAEAQTAKIRLSQIPSLCIATQYAAEELLRGEGFTDWRFLNELKKEPKG